MLVPALYQFKDPGVMFKVPDGRAAEEGDAASGHRHRIRAGKRGARAKGGGGTRRGEGDGGQGVWE